MHSNNIFWTTVWLSYYGPNICINLRSFQPKTSSIPGVSEMCFLPSKSIPFSGSRDLGLYFCWNSGLDLIFAEVWDFHLSGLMINFTASGKDFFWGLRDDTASLLYFSQERQPRVWKVWDVKLCRLPVKLLIIKDLSMTVKERQ